MTKTTKMTTVIPIALGVIAQGVGRGFRDWSHYHFRSYYEADLFGVSQLFEEAIPGLIILSFFFAAFAPWLFYTTGIYAISRFKGGLVILVLYFFGLVIGSGLFVGVYG